MKFSISDSVSNHGLRLLIAERVISVSWNTVLSEGRVRVHTEGIWAKVGAAPSLR